MFLASWGTQMTLSDYSRLLGFDANCLCVFKHNYGLKHKTSKEVFDVYIAYQNEQEELYERLQEVYYNISNFSKLGRFLVLKGLYSANDTVYEAFSQIFVKPRRLIGKKHLERRKLLLKYCEEYLNELALYKAFEEIKELKE